MRSSWRSALTGMVLAATGSGMDAAWAEPAPPFSELLRQAQATAPELVEGEANIRIAQGQAEQASFRPNPTVSLEVEDFAGNRSYSGLSRSQTTLSARQALELGGKRAARTAAGRAEVELARARQRQARADFAYALAVAYVAAEVGQAKVELLAQDLSRAEDDLRVAKLLVEAGREAELRRVQAGAAVTAVRADLERARADAAEALGRLSVIVGAAAPFTAPGPSLLAAAASAPADAAPSIDVAPAVVAAQAERDAAAQRVRVERTRATPDLTVTLGARHLAGDDATTLVGGVSAPLPLFDNNRGSVSAARAQLDAADARLQRARLETEASWRAGLFRSASAQTGLRAAQEGEAAAAEAYRLARIGYDAGRTALAELLNTRRALTEAQARTLDARSQRATAEATLARLAGRALGE